MFAAFFNSLVKGYLKYRHLRIQEMYSSPHMLQQEVFNNLLQKLKKVEYGVQFDAKNIESIKDFKSALPITSYEEIFPYIDRMMKGDEEEGKKS